MYMEDGSLWEEGNTFFARSRPVGNPCRKRNPTRHAPSQRASSVYLLLFNFSAALPCCDTCSWFQNDVCGSGPTILADSLD